MAHFSSQRLVIPIDFSNACIEAVNVGVQLALRPEDVHVLHVLPKLDVVSPGAIWGDVNDEERSRTCLRYMNDFLQQHGVSETPQRAIRFGEPAAETARFASEVGADLVVVPSHRHGGVKRILLGSVAERIARASECPVLILKRKD